MVIPILLETSGQFVDYGKSNCKGNITSLSFLTRFLLLVQRNYDPSFEVGLCQRLEEIVDAIKKIGISAEFDDYAAYPLLDLKKAPLGMSTMVWRSPTYRSEDSQKADNYLVVEE